MYPRTLASLVALVGALALAAPVRVDAQEVGLHVSLANWGDIRPASSMGAGGSISGTFRPAVILADTAKRRRSTLRLGFRASVTQLYSEEAEWYPNCPADAPCFPERGRLRTRVFHGFLSARPYESTRTRLDLGAGIAGYSFAGRVDDSAFGVTLGGSVARRLGDRSPMWVQLSYLRHGEDLGPTMADGVNMQPPDHSVAVGLVYSIARDP